MGERRERDREEEEGGFRETNILYKDVEVQRRMAKREKN